MVRYYSCFGCSVLIPADVRVSERDFKTGFRSIIVNSPTPCVFLLANTSDFKAENHAMKFHDFGSS